MGEPRVLFVSHTGTMSGAELVLCDAVAPWCGAAAFLFEPGRLAGALEERGLAVCVSRFGGGLAGLRRDASPLRVVPLLGRLAAIAVELARAARGCDILYANSQKAFVIACAAAALARRPLVWHLHDILDEAHFGRAQRILQTRLANAFAARVIVPSCAAAEAFVAAGGRRAIVETIPNGLDLPRETGERVDLRRELGLSDGPLVGVFSRLAPWKGQHVLIEALARVPEAQALVVGEALFGEDAYKARLIDLARRLGVERRVRFLGQRADVSRLMRAVDVVVHPSIDPEPFGRTLVEAMLAGTPLVATDAGASAEILEDGAAGTLVPPRDAAALAAAIGDALAPGEAKAARLRYAGERARRLYGAQRMRERIAALVRSLADRSSPEPARPAPSASGERPVLRVLVNMPSQYGGKPSGVALVAFRVIEHLIDRGGIAVVLRAPWTRDELPAALRDRIGLETVPRPRIMVLDVVRQLLSVPALCRRHGIDVVLNADPYGAAAGGTARVTIVHDLYFRTIARRTGLREALTTDFIFRLVLGRSAAVVTVSEATRRDLEAHYTMARGRTTTIPSAAVLDAAGDGASPDDYGRYVLAVGNATPNKNFEALARAVARLSAGRPDLGRDLAIVHVGEDPRETIASTLRGLGSGNRLVRLGRLDEAALAALYRGALCLCVPSLAEGFCLPILEAQAAGCPVLCADRSAMPEVAGDGALLFDAGDPDGLSAGLLRLLSEPDLRARLAERGYANESRYRWPRTAERYEAVLRAALARPRRAPGIAPISQASDAHPAS